MSKNQIIMLKIMIKIIKRNNNIENNDKNNQNINNQSLNNNNEKINDEKTIYFNFINH